MSLTDPLRHVLFARRYSEIRLLTSDCLGENFDRVSLQIVTNCPVWGVVDRHADGPPEGDGLLRNLCQSLMDKGLLRQRCIEVDAENLFDSDEGCNEDRPGRLRYPTFSQRWPPASAGGLLETTRRT
jgi:hypothetical protein